MSREPYRQVLPGLGLANGYDFSSAGYIPYDPAYADEIQVSIQEYLDDR